MHDMKRTHARCVDAHAIKESDDSGKELTRSSNAVGRQLVSDSVMHFYSHGAMPPDDDDDLLISGTGE